jgi:hypothetical protein
MIKYKRKRIIRITLAVIIPLFTSVTLFLILNYSQKISISDLDLISKTKNLFSSSDNLTDSNVKKTATSKPSVEKSAQDTLNQPLSNDEVDNDSILTISSLMYDVVESSNVDYNNIDTAQLNKDVMIASKTYTIPRKNADRQLDSLLMNRVDNSKTFTFTIEFWMSPIHFCGYKRSANKVIIFGISNYQDADLNMVNNDYYLVVNNNYYILELTDRFKKLTEVKP